jgi:hypothetical protein
LQEGTVEAKGRRLMPKTIDLTLYAEPPSSITISWPLGERDPRVPQGIYDNLVFSTSDGNDMLLLYHGNVFARITEAEFMDPTANIAKLVHARLVRHYLVKFRPELLVC